MATATTPRDRIAWCVKLRGSCRRGAPRGTGKGWSGGWGGGVKGWVEGGTELHVGSRDKGHASQVVVDLVWEGIRAKHSGDVSP